MHALAISTQHIQEEMIRTLMMCSALAISTQHIQEEMIRTLMMCSALAISTQHIQEAVLMRAYCDRKFCCI